MDDRIWQLLHVISNGLFAGGLVAVLLVQSLLQRATDDAERRSLARTSAVLSRVFVSQAANLGFATGLILLWTRFGALGAGKLMACTPVYVHLMLGFSLVSVGLAHAMTARARKLGQALDRGTTFAEARAHLHRGWISGLLAGVFALAAFTVAIEKVPNPPRNSCISSSG